MMTKKHFESAARLIRELPPGKRRQPMETFIVFFRTSNPRFDEARFVQACGEACVDKVAEARYT